MYIDIINDIHLSTLTFLPVLYTYLGMVGALFIAAWDAHQEMEAHEASAWITNLLAREASSCSDVVSTDRLEELFYGYTMDQLEEAMETVAILAKVQDPAAEMISLWENLLGVSLSDEQAEEDETSADAWAHLAEVMNETTFIGWIGDGRAVA